MTVTSADKGAPSDGIPSSRSLKCAKAPYLYLKTLSLDLRDDLVNLANWKRRSCGERTLNHEARGQASRPVLLELDLRNHQLRHRLVPTLGDVIERQAELLSLAGRKTSHLPAYHGNALPQH